MHYDNLWQLGHSLSFTYQVAPQRPDDAEVFSGSYLARVPNAEWLSFLTYAVKSNSDVASVGGTNIVGPGQIVGERAVLTLPTLEGLFHTISFGVDYKHFDQTVSIVDEVNRYRSGKIVVITPELRQRTVSGDFEIAKLDSFVTQVQQLFGAHATSLPGGIVILS